MKAQALFAHLLDRGFRFWVEGGDLCFRAPQGALTPELRADLKGRKQELLALLEEGKTYACSSLAQRRLWFLHEFDPSSPAYVMSAGTLLLEGPLAVDVLEEALTRVIERHESLRTTFEAFGGVPVQVIHRAKPIRLHVHDLTGQGERDIERAIAEETAQPIDLQHGPVFKPGLIRLGPLRSGPLRSGPLRSGPLRSGPLRSGAQKHILLLTVHHIVSDAWSLGIIWRDVCAFYEAIRKKSEPRLPELRGQCADFAFAQRSQCEDAAFAEQLAYWRERLSAPLPTLDVPTDRPRPLTQSYRGAQCPVLVSREVTAALRRVGREENATLFMTLLAAFSGLLSRHSGQNDIIVGSPIAGRRRSEARDQVGLFVNTLVLRTGLEGEPTFQELVRREREVVLGAFDHQDMPFERLVEEVQPERDMARNPLFQAMFVLQSSPTHVEDFGELKVTRLEPDVGTTQFDLMLSLQENAEGLFGWLRYNSDLFDASTIERMVGHFVTLLESIAADPTCTVTALPMLTEEERRQILADWNRTERAYPRDVCLHGLFEAQVERTPDAAALVFEEQTLTYRELNARANQLAHYLRKQGVGPDTPVGVCMERSLEMLIALYGILKAGGAYVPFDPSYPTERLAFMAQDTAVPVLLTQAALLDRLPSVDVRTLCLDAEWDVVAGESCENGVSTCHPRQLAYIIYTSGSTGKPKGVMNDHRGICNHMFWLQETFNLTGEDRALLKIPFSFDVSLWELFWPLLFGTPLVIARPDGHKDSGYLREIIQRHGITSINFVPSMLRAFLEEPGIERCTSLKRVLCIGEALPLDLQERFFERMPSVELHNLYGPTEAAVAVTWWPCEAGGRRSVVPIGYPIANTKMYITTAGLQPAPAGVSGELLIGGIQVARGYLNRAELTAERFIADPFSDDPVARLYKTGDLARYLPDGAIEFLGRMDHQIKIRGLRVELGEIEAALRNHASVNDTAVLAREDRPGDMRLVAYVASEVPEQELLPALRDSLSKTLPEYMTPSVFVCLEHLPLLTNGKVNRKALPVPSVDEGAVDDSFAAPRTPVEETVAMLWCEVLNIERAGIHSSFFDMGGHSLLATQLVSRVRERFRVETSLRSFLEQPTIEHLAALIESARGNGSAHFAPPITPISRQDTLPLSFAQQRLWFLAQMEPGSNAYNMPGALRLKGALDAAALTRALTEIVRRHEALRTTFPAEEGRPRQAIAPPYEVALPVVELQHYANPEAEMQRFIEQEARKGFDVAQGPLFRATLIHVGVDDHVLFVNMHHIVSDGWSLGVLTRELAALYEAYVAGTAPALAELRIQYPDFARWQREWLKDEALEAQLTYWREKLGGAIPALNLPFDHPRPKVQTSHGVTHRFTLANDLTERLRTLSRERGLTLFMTLLAGFKALLHRYTWEADIAVGCPIANRNRAEIEDLIGFFVNTLVLRTDLTGDPTFAELLERVRGVTLGAYAHQDVPFEKLVEELHPERDLSRTPLFQVMFVWQNLPATRLTLGGLKVTRLEMETGSTKLDINVHVEETERGIEGFFQYNRDLFEPETIVQMSECYRNLLESVVTNAEERLSNLHILPAAADRAGTMLPNLLRTHSSFVAFREEDIEQSIASRFEEQVRQHSEHVAVETSQDTWTYRRLNEEANRIAQIIVRQDGGAEGRVALLFDRGAFMVAAMLGALKALRAYVPLDTTYPAERLAFMLEDSQSTVLLTDRGDAGCLTNAAIAVVYVSESEPAVSRGTPQEPVLPNAAAANANALAYILYTSGSTGNPKGVMQNHRNVLHFIRAYTNTLRLTANDRLTLFSAFGFDAAVMDVYGALLNGATLIQPDLRNMRPEDVTTWLREQRITVYHSTPTVFRAYIGVTESAAPSHVRAVVLGGEEVRTSDVDLFRKRFSDDCVFVNLLGSSESSYNMYCILGHDAEPPRGVVPLGAPVENTQIVLVNERGEDGQVYGEIAILSPHVALGYWRRPDLTHRVFVECPGERGQRMYRTGDMGRLLPNGSIAFMGRRDTQVKIRGFRVELGEIESALTQHVDVREAVVVAWTDMGSDSPSDCRLAAYIVPENRCAIAVQADAASLRRFLIQKLPEHMIPSVFVSVDALPRTANGKTDRRALPKPARIDPARSNAHVEPVGAVEQQLALIWRELLKVERVGQNDNFFELGGHSLLATQLVSRIAKDLDAKMPLRTLFERPTLAELAEAVTSAEARASDEAASLSQMPHVSRPSLELCAAGRRRMALENQLDELEQLGET